MTNIDFKDEITKLEELGYTCKLETREVLQKRLDRVFSKIDTTTIEPCLIVTDTRLPYTEAAIFYLESGEVYMPLKSGFIRTGNTKRNGLLIEDELIPYRHSFDFYIIMNDIIKKIRTPHLEQAKLNNKVNPDFLDYYSK